MTHSSGLLFACVAALLAALLGAGCGDDAGATGDAGQGDAGQSDSGQADAGRTDALDCSTVGCGFQACGEPCTAPCGCCPPVCDGGAPDATGDASSSGCRGQADCADTESCVASDDVACGIGCPDTRECETHAECPAGQECEEYLPGCCPIGSPLASRCRPMCTGSATECGTCDGTTCRPQSCEDGHTCPAFTECTPTDAAADPHGCLRSTCTTDADCDSGAGVCVNGRCYEQAGTCQPPAA